MSFISSASFPSLWKTRTAMMTMTMTQSRLYSRGRQLLQQQQQKERQEPPKTLGRHPRSLTAPLAAFTMALLLGSYCISSIRAARREARYNPPDTTAKTAKTATAAADAAAATAATAVGSGSDSWVARALEEERREKEEKEKEKRGR